MTTCHELTGLQRDLLTAIAGVEDWPYGLALKAYLNERTNAYRLTDDGTQLL